MSKYSKPAERRLNAHEIAIASKLIANASAGPTTAKLLWSDLWGSMRRQVFGKYFKASVLAGDLPGIVWVRRRSDRSQEYRIV